LDEVLHLIQGMNILFKTMRSEEEYNMSKIKKAVKNETGSLTEDVRALLSATGDAAGETISDARDRLSAVLEHGQEIYGEVHDQALARVKAVDKFIRTNPYSAVAIALGVGALISRLFHGRDKE